MSGSRGAHPMFGPAITLGIGLGCMLDGIMLHQLLGWHHVLSARPEVDMRANEVADGLFHLGCWLVVVAGVVWLFARLRTPPVAAAWPRVDGGPRPWRALIGPMLLGWGMFNVVEGVVDHHLLGLHHVRPGPNQLGWDLGYLVLGAVLMTLGLVIDRRQPRLRQPAPADDEALQR